METKILDPNTIVAVTDANSGIANTTVVYYNSDAPTPIFTINPIPDVEPEPKSEVEPVD